MAIQPATKTHSLAAEAGRDNNTGDGNTFFGGRAGLENTAGNGNSYFGNAAGQQVNAGDNNTFVGYNAFVDAIPSVSNNNTLIGANTRIAALDLSFATAIGSDSSVVTSNTIAIGRNTGADTVRIYGNLVVDGTINGSLSAKGSEALRSAIETQREQIRSQQDEIQKLNSRLETQQKQFEIQSAELGELKRALCEIDPHISLCAIK